MNNGQPFDAKEQVRQATDIVDLVGSYMQLRRQGRNYVGLCPWHDDSRPSMQVNPERQSFKCWVCDIGGDVFSFVMKIDGLEFREALETLAERANITLQPTHGTPPTPGGPGDKKTLLKATAWAEEQFHRCLLSSPKAEEGRNYLADRGVSAESIARFKIGYAPNEWDWLIGQAKGTGLTPAVLDRVGLILKRQKGEGWYDRFRGRVMFPIRDVRSRCIAFGGRILPQLADDKSAKYVNSPETPLFSKSSQLYALDLSRDAIASEGQIVVTEGYTDVIAAHQHGVQNVVAVLGTALGEKHLPLIRRFTDRITLVLDGDEAGQRRTNEVLELFVANQVDLRILTLPDGSDPCDFVSSTQPGFGPESFRQLINAAPDALQHKLTTVTSGVTSADQTHAASQAVEQVLGTLAKARSALGEVDSSAMIREQGILGRLARKLQLPEDGLRQRLAALRRSANRTANRPPVQQPQSATSMSLEDANAAALEAASEEGDSVDSAALPPVNIADLPNRERELAELLMLSKESAEQIFEKIPVTRLASNAARRVYLLIAETLQRDGEVDFHRLMLVTQDESLKNLLVELDEACQAKSGSNVELRLSDLLAAFTRQEEDAQRREQSASLRDGNLQATQEDEVLSNIFAKLKSRQTGPLSTDG